MNFPMSRRGLSSCLQALAAAVLLPVVPGALAAESPRFPERPMRMLVGFAPGSLTDLLARTVGQKMTEQWGQPVVIDNRPSGGGVVASQSMLAANPDGHTLLMVSAQHAASASLFTKLGLLDA